MMEKAKETKAVANDILFNEILGLKNIKNKNTVPKSDNPKDKYVQ